MCNTSVNNIASIINLHVTEKKVVRLILLKDERVIMLSRHLLIVVELWRQKEEEVNLYE